MAHPLNIACLPARFMATMAQAIDDAMGRAGFAVQAEAEILLLPENCGDPVYGGNDKLVTTCERSRA